MLEKIKEKLRQIIILQQMQHNRFQGQPVFISILEMTSLVNIRDYLGTLGESREGIQLLEKEIQAFALFLLSQFSRTSTLNYLPRTKDSSYPDDIDDTCSAFYAIGKYNSTLITPHHIANLLIALDSLRFRDQPYAFNTWCVDIEKEIQSSESEWLSLDPIVLCAVAACFELWNIPCTELKNFIYESLSTFNAESSAFYDAVPLPLYLASRIEFDFAQRQILAEKLCDYLGRDTFAPNKYICLAALSRFQPDNALLEAEDFETDYDVIEAEPLYIESTNQDKEAGSVHAYSLYFNQLVYIEASLAALQEPKGVNPRSDDAINKNVSKYINGIIDQCMPSGHQRNTVIRDLSDSLINSIDFNIFADIYLLSLAVKDSEDDSMHSPLYIHGLGLLAYYLYDKLYDGELSADFLPCLIYFHRIFHIELTHLLGKIGAQNTSRIFELLDQTDIFNLNLPCTHGDINNMDQIAFLSSIAGTPLTDHYQKSQGSILMYLTLFPHYEKLFGDFFKHFLLARQIADDIEDFEKDLSIGKLSTAYYFLDLSNFTGSNISECSVRMNRAFSIILEHCNLARKALQLEHKSPNLICEKLNQYLTRFEKSVQQKRFEWSIIHELQIGMRMKSTEVVPAELFFT